jgi:hypothetical protein
MLQGGTPILPNPCDAMKTSRPWLRITRITDDWIELSVGQLGHYIQPRSSLLHGAAADEQRSLRPEVQQAQMYGPFYEQVGRLLCEP